MNNLEYFMDYNYSYSFYHKFIQNIYDIKLNDPEKQSLQNLKIIKI